MPAPSFSYNGSTTVSCTFDSVVGQQYFIQATDGFSSLAFTTSAVSTSTTLTITDIGALTAGTTFAVYVGHPNVPLAFGLGGIDYVVAGTILAYGSVGEFTLAAAWAYNGGQIVTIDTTGIAGNTYAIEIQDDAAFYSGTTVATGSPQTFTLNTGATLTADKFSATFVDYGPTASDYHEKSVRLFTGGAASAGFLGNPLTSPDPGNTIQGVSVAFDDTMLEPDPTWTRIDTEVRVSRWEIRRGRQDEREKTEPATATVFVNDIDGLLDPTNTGSPWFGLLDGRQLALARWNPVTGEWFTRFRGTIEEYGYDLHPSQAVTEVAIRAVGFMGYLARAEMAPGAAGFATTEEGGILYEDAEVNDRIDAVHADAGLDPALTVTFSGNVVCDESRYPPGYSFLAALFDAADAEFAGVSNVYEDRFGRIVFHGRHARFDPQTVADDAGPDAWDFHVWKAGDEDAIVIDPTTAQIRPPLQYDRSLDRVINAGLATPQVRWSGTNRVELTAAEIQANIVTDAVSIGKYGVRSWSAPDLHIKAHKTNGNTGLQEAFNQASYYVTNNADPVTRPRQITFESLLADDARADATWGLICEVDISDVIHLTVTNPGGGGFDDDYFVEGITETSTFAGPFTPLAGEYDNAELTVDVSPEAWYTEDPFNDEGS